MCCSFWRIKNLWRNKFKKSSSINIFLHRICKPFLAVPVKYCVYQLTTLVKVYNWFYKDNNQHLHTFKKQSPATCTFTRTDRRRQVSHACIADLQLDNSQGYTFALYYTIYYHALAVNWIKASECLYCTKQIRLQFC